MLRQLPAAFALVAAFSRSQSHLQARGPSSEGGEARVPQPHSAPELATLPSDKGITSSTQELQEQSPMQDTTSRSSPLLDEQLDCADCHAVPLLTAIQDAYI
jgi:hypothetical protein